MRVPLSLVAGCLLTAALASTLRADQPAGAPAQPAAQEPAAAQPAQEPAAAQPVAPKPVTERWEVRMLVPHAFESTRPYEKVDARPEQVTYTRYVLQTCESKVCMPGSCGTPKLVTRHYSCWKPEQVTETYTRRTLVTADAEKPFELDAHQVDVRTYDVPLK